MENGKRSARGERKLLQSARRPGTLQEPYFRFSCFVQPRVTYIQISQPLFHLMDTSAFVGTNPTDEPITSGLSVIQEP